MIPIFVTDSLIETSQLIYSFVPNRLIVGEEGGGGVKFQILGKIPGSSFYLPPLLPRPPSSIQLVTKE